MTHDSTLKYRKERQFLSRQHICLLFRSPISFDQPQVFSRNIINMNYSADGLFLSCRASEPEPNCSTVWQLNKYSENSTFQTRICKNKGLNVQAGLPVLHVSSYSYKKTKYYVYIHLYPYPPPKKPRERLPENKPNKNKVKSDPSPFRDRLVCSINCIMHCYQLNILVQDASGSVETMQWFSWEIAVFIFGNMAWSTFFH